MQQCCIIIPTHICIVLLVHEYKKYIKYINRIINYHSSFTCILIKFFFSVVVVICGRCACINVACILKNRTRLTWIGHISNWKIINITKTIMHGEHTYIILNASKVSTCEIIYQIGILKVGSSYLSSLSLWQMLLKWCWHC